MRRLTSHLLAAIAINIIHVLIQYDSASSDHVNTESQNQEFSLDASFVIIGGTTGFQ